MGGSRESITDTPVYSERFRSWVISDAHEEERRRKNALPHDKNTCRFCQHRPPDAPDPPVSRTVDRKHWKYEWVHVHGTNRHKLYVWHVDHWLFLRLIEWDGDDSGFTMDGARHGVDLAGERGAESAPDCKTLALSGGHVPGLSVVAGYVVRSARYTEHWWCIDAGGAIVDATGLSQGAALYPLASQGDDPRGVCMAYSGACDHEGAPCAWCSARSALAARGYERAPLDALWRPMVGFLIRDSIRLRTEIESLRREFERFSKKGRAE